MGLSDASSHQYPGSQWPSQLLLFPFPVVEYRPRGQACDGPNEGSGNSAGVQYPAGVAVHSVSRLLLAPGWYLPAGQDLQVLDSTSSWYCPAGQFRHEVRRV